MSFDFLGPDLVDEAISRVLDRLKAGDPPSAIEITNVDVKEERGRRNHGSITLGAAENETAAQHLAEEMACFANTPGGGAIILGITDEGQRVGTNLDPDWLRHRIWELTNRQLSISAEEISLDGVRLLILKTREGAEPIRYRNRLKWRLDDNCVEVDATTFLTERLRRTGLDWSAQPSGHSLKDLSAIALEIARRYLLAARDSAAEDLASASNEDLLRRLNLVDGNDRLSNAGSLLFVGTPHIGIDYIRREFPGGDSTNRVRSKLSLLEQISETEKATEAVNRLVHVPGGFAHGQVRAIPARALREAIINGVVHRDWLTAHPTTVEHVGDRVTVTSPGGFVGGVGPTNIITHPSVPRYRSLAEAVTALRLAEREGIGVDRMVRDMLALGHPEPFIEEVTGPAIRVVLVGGDPHPQLLSLLAAVSPPEVTGNVESLLLINHVVRLGWVDVARAAPILQRSQVEAQAALHTLARARLKDIPLIVPVRGVPTGDAYRLGDVAREWLKESTRWADGIGARDTLIPAWAGARGRVSSTEIADITGLSTTRVGTILTSMEEDGLLLPGRETRRGRGFYYIPAP